MAVIATSLHTKGNVIKKELWAGGGYVEEAVVVNDTAGTLLVGTVLGKVTASGKYKRAVQTAGDGSAAAAAIVTSVITIAGATDTKVLCAIRGPARVSKTALVLDASYDQQAELDQVYADLTAKGIQVLDTI